MHPISYSARYMSSAFFYSLIFSLGPHLQPEPWPLAPGLQALALAPGPGPGPGPGLPYIAHAHAHTHTYAHTHVYKIIDCGLRIGDWRLAIGDY